MGVGLIGRVHADKLANAVPSARLIAVSDSGHEAAANLAALYGVKAAHLDEMLVDAAVEALVIATPPSTHVELIQLAVGAGKHVLCEKPLAYDSSEAILAVQAAREAKVTLQIGFHRRFDRDFRIARERITAGELGDVKLFFSSHRDMTASQPTYRERVLFDHLCHDFDAARWMVGEISEVMAIGNDQSDPDDVVVLLRFSSGAVGTIDGSRAAGYGFECRTEIVGSAATVRVPTRPKHELEWLVPGFASRLLPATFLERFNEAYALELEDFAQGILTGQPPTVSGDDGVAAVRLCEAADQSLREQRVITVASRPSRHALP